MASSNISNRPDRVPPHLWPRQGGVPFRGAAFFLWRKPTVARPGSGASRRWRSGQAEWREVEPRIEPRLVTPGHCAGWRAKAKLAVTFASGRYEPSVVGT